MSDHCAFFLAERGPPGHIVEEGATDADLRAPAGPAHRRLRATDGSDERRRRWHPAGPVDARSDAGVRRSLDVRASAPDRIFAAAARVGGGLDAADHGADRPLPRSSGAGRRCKPRAVASSPRRSGCPETGTFGIASLLVGHDRGRARSRWSSRCRWVSAPRCSSASTRRARLQAAARLAVDLMAAVPSIVYGAVGPVLPAAAPARPRAMAAAAPRLVLPFFRVDPTRTPPSSLHVARRSSPAAPSVWS